jgi:hypothetical protein
MLIEKDSYKIVSLPLCAGDRVFMFTSGIEGTIQRLGDKQIQIYAGETKNDARIQEGKSHISEAKSIQLRGLERLYELINAVFNKRHYTIRKWEDPSRCKTISLNFRTYTGSAKEAVLAVASIGKLLRVKSDALIPSYEVISLESALDVFLKEHFDQYGEYFSGRIKEEHFPDEAHYAGSQEDSQVDDFSLLAIRMKL